MGLAAEPGDHTPRLELQQIFLRRHLDPVPANLCIRKTKPWGAVEEHHLHTGVKAGAVGGIGQWMEKDVVQGIQHRALLWFSSSQPMAQHMAGMVQDSTGVAEDGPEDPAPSHLQTIMALQDLMSLLFFPCHCPVRASRQAGFPP